MTTTDLAQRRKGKALTLFLVAGALVAVAAVTTAIEIRSARPDLASGPVIPGLENTIGGAERIAVTSGEATYHIERVQRGAERVWVMRDRGDFPVRAARLAQLTDGLEQLRYTRRMTSDASKHQRLGVTDPREGGRGILVQIEDGRGALLVNLILGVETSGLYVRRPDSPQTWAARGELPPLRDVSSWLDLQPLQVLPDALARVEVTPAEGRAYVLARETPDAGWRIASPAVAALAESSVAAAAERITQLQPVDVQEAPAIQGAPRARIRAATYDGVVIEGEVVESDGRFWVKLVARAEAPEQAPAAQAINDRVSAWAYALSELDAEMLAPSLSALIGGED